MKPGLRCAVCIVALPALIGLIVSCPLPYDFSGEGAGQDVASDPSSPHVTAPVAISYSEEGGTSGTLPNDGTHVSAVTTTVTLSTDTENAVIYYTDDGLEITSFGSVKKISGSSGSITINRSAGVERKVIWAVAVGSGMLPSPPIHATVSVSAFPILSVTALDAEVFESGAETGFTIQSSEVIDADLTVNLSTDGNYEAGEDVFGLGEVPGGPGSTLTATIPADSDSVFVGWSSGSDPDEFDDETVTLIIEPGDGYAIGAPASATCIIQDDMTPTVSISQSSSSIFDDGGVNLVTITSNLTLATQDLVVTLRPTGSYEASDLSSVPAAGTNFTMTIPAGSNYAEREIQASADPGEFDDETVTLTVLDGAEYNVGTPSSVNFVVEDTSPVPQLTLSTTASTITDTFVGTFTITASEAPDWNLPVNLTHAGFIPEKVSALYTSVQINAGTTSTTFTLDPLQAVGYGRMAGSYSLVPGTGYTVGAPSSQAVTVVDDTFGAFDYVGYWDFDTDLGSNVGSTNTWSLTGGATRSGGRLSFPETDAALDRGSVVMSGGSTDFNKDEFTIAFKFSMGSFLQGTPPERRAIMSGGSSYRWFTLYQDGSGNPILDFNNHSINFPLTSIPNLSVGTDYVLVMSVNTTSRNVVVTLLNASFGLLGSQTLTLAPGFTWNTDGQSATFDENLISADPSRGTALHGTYDWVFVANRIFTAANVTSILSGNPYL